MDTTPCKGITEGMSMNAMCSDCGHVVRDHAYPSMICTRCSEPSTYDVGAASLLGAVPARWSRPPKEMVSKLDRGKGVKLDYVGHADTTLMLIDVDPCFTYDYHRDERGRMDMYEQGPNWVLEGTLTLFGVTRPCVGTCEKRKVEIHKELLGDLLRNGAMRYGIATALWSKVDDAADAHYRGQQTEEQGPTELSAENVGKFNKVCRDAGLEPAAVMGKAFPSGAPEVLLDSHLPAMRAAFKALKQAGAVREAAATFPSDPDEVPLDDASGAMPLGDDERLASAAQVKKIQVLMGEHGVTDRAKRLEFIKDALGLIDRPGSTKNLTVSQAHDLIEAMEAGAK